MSSAESNVTIIATATVRWPDAMKPDTCVRACSDCLNYGCRDRRAQTREDDES